VSGQALGAVLFGLFAGGWLGRALFDWILDVGAPWEGILIAAAALLGAGICVAGWLEERAGSS
jgi:hypothetical protein